MSTDCERLRELAPELALRIADGEDRAWALEHLADCPACRAHLERLSVTADELTLLAPPAEPPAGFEDRVVGALAPAPRHVTWRQRLAIPALAAAAAAAVAALAVWVATDDDRDLADSYRDTLAVADGEYFDATRLAAPGGGWVGYVYGYQGHASWVMAVVQDRLKAGHYRVELITEKGGPKHLAPLSVAGGEGSVGAVTPVPYEKIAAVRLLDERGREVARSRLAD